MLERQPSMAYWHLCQSKDMQCDLNPREKDREHHFMTDCMSSLTKHYKAVSG